MWGYKGRLSCFLGGRLCFLLESNCKARIILKRVFLGSITSSIYPYRRHCKDWQNYPGILFLFCYKRAGSSVSAISFPYNTSMAPEGPITAISAEGQA